MSRLLTLLIIITIMVAPASLVSAAICQHQTPIDHALARADSDAKVSNIARTEDTAASLAKKGTLSDAPSASLLADMLPPAELIAPLRDAEPFRRLIRNDSRLPDIFPSPLLEPPAA